MEIYLTLFLYLITRFHIVKFSKFSLFKQNFKFHLFHQNCCVDLQQTCVTSSSAQVNRVKPSWQYIYIYILECAPIDWCIHKRLLNDFWSLTLSCDITSILFCQWTKLTVSHGQTKNGHDITWNKVKVMNNQDFLLFELAHAQLCFSVFCQPIRNESVGCHVHTKTECSFQACDWLLATNLELSLVEYCKLFHLFDLGLWSHLTTTLPTIIQTGKLFWKSELMEEACISTVAS